MKRICFLTASVLLALPLLGQAYEAYTVDDVQLQAGPDEAYPTITELPAGAEVALQGCIDGWSWCDVIAGQDRGWVPASYLEEDYDNRRVTVVDYGPRIGIPVVAFSLGVYWDHHYHSRPFYAQRQEWVSRSITPHAPPRPTGIAATGTRQAPAVTTREQQRAPATTTATTPPADRSTRTVRTPAAQEPDRTGSANTSERQKAERAQAPVAQHEPKAAAPSDAAPQLKQPAEPPKAAPAQRTAMQQHPNPKAEQKPRSNEPKAKDELKAPPKKGEGDNKKKDDDKGG